MRVKPLFWVVLVVVAAGILGGIHTPPASAASGDNVRDNLRAFASALALIEDNFADPVSPDLAIYHGAIPSMLHNLDPHSNFLDPNEFKAMRQNQRGHYFGVGMEVGMDGPAVVVMQPFPGSPAQRAGLRRGDIIVQVDEKSVEGYDYGKVADLLKGPRGTQVKVGVRRSGDRLSFDVIRDAISPMIVDSFWLRPGIAYVRIRTFESQTVTREVESAFRKLGEGSVTGLVLDLRGNPGGLVTEAVSVAGRFLRKGQTVVSHHGRAETEQVFTAKNGGNRRNYPIVILVNRSSASAAEIVTGALQDHDRAWVMGESTFGKGLVQAQFPLSQETALLLTIARYYTPSGRLIQRDYSHSSFFKYYFSRGSSARNPRDVKTTDTGRTVYGGGGITPDEKYESPKLSTFQRRIMATRAIFHFASESQDSSVDAFRAWLKIPFTAEEFEGGRSWIAQQLRIEEKARAEGKAAADQLTIESDPEVRHAIDSLPQAQALLQKTVARSATAPVASSSTPSP